MTVPKFKRQRLPRTLGACIDLALRADLQRKAYQAEADRAEQFANEVKRHVVDTFRSADLDGATGREGAATYQPKTVGEVTDWKKLHAHVRRTGEFDLLQRRLSSAAFVERLDAKQRVPGVRVRRFNVLRVRKKPSKR